MLSMDTIDILCLILISRQIKLYKRHVAKRSLITGLIDIILFAQGYKVVN